MAIQEVIKYEGEINVLIYKYPAEDFNTLSTLIVHESQEAVFFSDGQALDSFKAGRYTLETKNIPLISKLRNLVTGGVSPFHVEVYFINLATLMDIPWGTPSQVTVKDPMYGYSYSAGASGSFGIRITDGRKLLINMVGTEKLMSINEVQRYFRDLIVTRVKNCIAVELSKYSFNVFNQHLNEISDHVAGQIGGGIADYGIQVINFFLSAVNIKTEDLEELKRLDNTMAQKRFEAMGNREAAVIEAEGMAKAREIQGYTWQQEQQFDVSRTFAGNEGFAANPANMMAQVPLAFSMGNVLRDQVVDAAASARPQTEGGKGQLQGAGWQQSASQPMAQPQPAIQPQPMVQPQPAAQPQSPKLTCTKCGTVMPGHAKFCFNCGEKLAIGPVHCTQCGFEIPPEAKFCMNCGARRES